jgi:hypothetical protein
MRGLAGARDEPGNVVAPGRARKIPHEKEGLESLADNLHRRGPVHRIDVKGRAGREEIVSRALDQFPGEIVRDHFVGFRHGPLQIRDDVRIDLSAPVGPSVPLARIIGEGGIGL